MILMIAKIIGGHQWTTLLKYVEKDRNVIILMIMMMLRMTLMMIAKIIGDHQWTTLFKHVEKDKNVTMLMIMMMSRMNANIIGEHREAQSEPG